MNILIVANTYYQLITALQLNYTLFKDDNITLLFSDMSKGTEEVCTRLRKHKTFHDVAFIQTKSLYTGKTRMSFYERIKSFLQLSLGTKNYYSFMLKDVADLRFDEIICTNYGMDIYGIYTYLYQFNKDIKISLFEEGILSYKPIIDIADRTVRRRKKKIIDYFRHILKKKTDLDVFSNFYCFFPEIFQPYNKGWNLSVVEIPRIRHNSPCVKALLQACNITSLSYPEKYIYFTSIGDFEGGAYIGEFELVCRIANLVGKDNLLIKLHPRDARSVYTDAGFKVDRNSHIPWEAIQLSMDFSSNIFLTATSGSVLAGSFMSYKPVKTFYLFPLCNKVKNVVISNTSTSLKRLFDDVAVKPLLENVFIIDKLEKILE